MAFNTRSKELHFLDIDGHDNAVIIDKYPDQCPLCGHGIDVKGIGAYGKTDRYSNTHHIQAIFQCPRLECQTVFIAIYASPTGFNRNHSEYVFLRNHYVPTFYKNEQFDEEIGKLSPNFIAIYRQAKIADDMSLDLICGTGYRKALEFLIKDYLILIKPDKKDEILKRKLGWLIAKEVSSEKVKLSAGLAKDVGNDEAHYQRKMEELSLEDQKKLTKLTTHWISDELTLMGYLEKIVPKKDKK